MTVKVNPGDRPQAIEVATDEISGTHYPIYKTGYGAEGDVSQVSVGNPLPVIQTGHSGNQAVVGVYGEQLAVDIKNDVIITFIYGISSYDVISEVLNGGSVGSQSSMGYVSSGTAADGQAKLYSVENVRYRPAHTAIAHFTALFESGPVEGADQYIGPFNSTDGIYLGYNGTDRVVGYRNTSTDIVIPEADWNGDPRVKDSDWTKLNLFRIKYGWLGASPIIFQTLLPGTDQWVNIHTVRIHGVATHPHIGVPSMPMKMMVKKTSGSTDVIIRTGSWQAGVFGFCQTCGNRPFSASVSGSSVGTTPVTLAVFKSRDTHQGLSNKVFSRLLRYQFHVDTPVSSNDYGTIRFRLIENPTLTGTPSYVDLDADNSVMQNVTGVSYSSGGIIGLTEYQGYAGGKGNTVPSVPSVSSELGLRLIPGRTYAIVADRVSGSGTPDVRATFNWAELF